jgi:hypothetical protein
LLPAKWIIRAQQPDFHLDYFVEPTEAGELTGINVGIQLKGWNPTKNYAKSPTYSLRTKHLLYYREKCEFPVFLVLIDITNHQGYWVFMQQFGNKPNREQLRKHKRILVRFALQDTLTDIPRFTQAILDSVKFMRELRPSSIDAAVLQRRKELQAKDPRLDVQIELINGRQNIIANAKEEIPFTISFKKSDLKTIESLKDFFEKGADLLVKKEEIEFKGCPIFDEVKPTKEGEIRIQFRRESEGHALFSWGENDPEANVYIPGSFLIGTKFLTFEGKLLGSPFEVTSTVPRPAAYSLDAFSTSMGFYPRRWQNQRLLVLPHFEIIYRFFQALLGGKEVFLRLYAQGNLICTLQLTEIELQKLKGSLPLLEALNKARVLAARFRLDPVLPAFTKSLKRDLMAIEELHSLLFSKEYRSPVPHIKISFRALKPPGVENLDDKSDPLTIMQEVCEYKVFGQPVHVGPIRTIFTQLRFVRQTPLAELGWVNVELEGTERSERIDQYEGAGVSGNSIPKPPDVK